MGESGLGQEMGGSDARGWRLWLGLGIGLGQSLSLRHGPVKLLQPAELVGWCRYCC